MPEKLKATDLQSILVKVLDQRVAIGGAKRKTMSKREAILRVLLEKAAEGHVAAMDVLFDSFQFDGAPRGRSYDRTGQPILTYPKPPSARK